MSELTDKRAELKALEAEERALRAQADAELDSEKEAAAVAAVDEQIAAAKARIANMGGSTPAPAATTAAFPLSIDTSSDDDDES